MLACNELSIVVIAISVEEIEFKIAQPLKSFAQKEVRRQCIASSFNFRSRMSTMLPNSNANLNFKLACLLAACCRMLATEQLLWLLNCVIVQLCNDFFFLVELLEFHHEHYFVRNSPDL